MRKLVATLILFVPVALKAQDVRLDHYGLGPGRLRELCAAAEPGDQVTLLQRQRDIAFKLHQAGADDTLWRSYACALSILYAHAPRDTNNRVPLVSRFAIPAVDAFAHVLERHPNDKTASSGLAAMAFDLTEGPDVTAALGYSETFAELAYAAVRAGVTTPIVLRMCTEFAFATSDIATARFCNHRALALGVDSTWQLMRSVWFALLEDDRHLGAALFDRAVAAAHDSAELDEAGWHVHRLVDAQTSAAGAATSAWAGLSDSQRVAWVHAHLATGTSDTAASFAGALSQREGDVSQHGAVFELCPFEIIRNGSPVSANRTGCRGTAGHPPRVLGLAAAVVRLWDPSSGRPIALLTYALDRYALGLDVTPSSRSATVQLDWRQWEWQTAQWTDSSSQVHLAIPDDLMARPYVAGYLLVKPADGEYSWTLSVRQPGRFGETSRVAAVAPTDSSFVLSDLILGVPEQGLSWKLGGDTIALAPLNTLPRNKMLELYYQLRNDAGADDFTTRVVIRKIESGRIEPEPELSIQFPFKAHPGINGVQRLLDISRSGAGNHHLEVQILDHAGHVIARRGTNLLLQ